MNLNNQNMEKWSAGNTRELLFFASRVILYSLLMVLLNAVFFYDARHATATGKFGELSGTEILQELFLFLSGVLFLITGRKDKTLAPVTNLVSLLFFMAFIREFNNQLEYWFYLVLPLALLSGWLLLRNRHVLFPALLRFIRKPEIPWFIAGFLVTFVFSRFFGRTAFWEALLEGNYSRWAKNAAEEGVELLGCSFFLIAGIEILVSTRKNRKNNAL